MNSHHDLSAGTSSINKCYTCSINNFLQILLKNLYIFLCCLILSSCITTEPNTPTASSVPVFTSAPEIELDPNLSAPLAALLNLSTDIPTKITLLLDNQQGETRSIQFEDFSTTHALNVLGFHADKTYRIKVTAISRSGNKTNYHELLEVTTDPLPDGFPTISIRKNSIDEMEPGYTLFDVIPEGDNAEFGALIVIVDHDGEVVWYQTGSRYSDVRQYSKGRLIFIEGAKIVVMDMLGERVHEWHATVNPPKPNMPGILDARGIHHEVFPMEIGNLLTLSIESRVFDNYRTDLKDADAPKETANVVGDVVVEFRPDGTIRKKWYLLDLLDPYRLGWDSLNTYWDQMFGNKKTRDWSHGNSVIHDPKDNSIIYTSRHQDATIKFTRSTGQLKWILAPPENWDKNKFAKYLLKPVNNQKYFFPYHSHSPMVMPNGNLLIYDNGNNRTGPFDTWVKPADNFSRAVEYKIDEKTNQVELVWEYGQFVKEPIFSGALGDADYLPITGNVLITHGTIFHGQYKLSAKILEVTHETPAKEVFEMDIHDPSANEKNGWRVYRSERIPSLYWK